jgi:hypothetical protein
MGTLALFPAVFQPFSLFKTAPFQLSYPDTRLVPLMVTAVENPHQLTHLAIARNFNYTGHYTTYIPTSIACMDMCTHSIEPSVCFTKY